MIALRDDFLLVQGPEGTFLPCSVDQLTLEFVGHASALIDPDVLQHAAAGVLHYFKHELGRQYVSVGEFSTALAKVLGGLGITAEVTEVQDAMTRRSADLRTLASDAGKMGELEFFNQLRTILRQQLAEKPRLLEFRGLRSCVKQLAGRKHWCPTCDRLENQIVAVMRGWFELEPHAKETALIVR